MNIQILVGHLGADPAVHTFDSGNKICKFPLATNFSYKKKGTGEWVNHTDWHNIVVSGPVVAYVENHFKKGSKASLSGRTRTREYTDASDVKRYVTEVVVDKINLEDKHVSSANTTAPGVTENQEPDDLPF